MFIVENFLNKFSFVAGNLCMKPLHRRHWRKMRVGLGSRRQSHGNISPEGTGIELTERGFSAKIL